jgi:hypothetical protein
VGGRLVRKTWLNDAPNQPMKITENGRRRKITKREAVIAQLVSKICKRTNTSRQCAPLSPTGFRLPSRPDRHMDRDPGMDKTTNGAWLLAQSKNLDAVTGAGAARLENISYAGRIGRLYNLLRRNVANDPNPTIDAVTARRICQLNNIDRPSRETGLRLLWA